ncbi:Na+/H+ antiporter NhaA [Albidovulum sp.]|mgnify:CR=1 FL=1|uniref:Na+/H+ antiporter NhaA n=1 Tax=Albidovulum sp. TaxID=1872424 RepID=UPI001DA5DB4C|nr:Na+/H+ antiporter NhaA [Paracoccaceae bacterium]MCC0047458.1 Na+/H+ antiporter NhaA [Defluviimonas sp.]HPE25362.1 Na+/H+ antiporter NhaA [Albidovulum sp.]MCB2118227.1 Na+/H+ antiporter NhaA [Paracoccaceae bacterium]MCB2121844.1 Na+/H+ antiporter NhaA [Paracoccaceae bacterium]
MPIAKALHRLYRHEAAPGVLLMGAALLALYAANSAFSAGYYAGLEKTFSILLDGEGLSKPLILWINDGLMAVFFFLIGLELKREMVEGKLKNPRDVMLPGAAAVGGMVVPALIYLVFNAADPLTVGGWAIPAATDIAFAVGVLALVGKRAPASLKIFLLTLAILDDLGAIVIIALFYTRELHVEYLAIALAPLAGMFLLNRAGVHRIAPFILLGIVLWVLVLKSGVHATLAGVVAAFFIPLKDRYGKSPLHALEHALTPYVNFLIVPIFAFANAGVLLKGLSVATLFEPLPLGIAAGLVIGKQLGVFGTTWLMVRAGWASLPHAVTWMHIYGLSCLAGIGFTMSLFIGGLSFDDIAHMNAVRIGVLTASAISAVLGFAVLRIANPKEALSRPSAQEA